MEIQIFQGKKVLKENVSCRCFLMIMLDSVIRLGKKYYPETLLEKCNYEIKKTKLENLINDEFEPSSSDVESDKEPDNE